MDLGQGIGQRLGFSVDVGNACGEEWEFIAMCVDNDWSVGAQWDFPASSSATSVEDEIAR